MSTARVVCLLGIVAISGEAAATPAVYTNTTYVEGLASDGKTLWAATRGGLEGYDLATLARTALFTSRDGLPGSWARRVAVVDGAVEVDTERARCRMMGARFVCAPRAVQPADPAAPAPSEHGHRVTASLDVAGRRFVGTAGDGVWLDADEPRRLTPAQQICANHVVAIAQHQGVTYLGAFDEGLCRVVDGRAEPIATPFRMVNRLVSTPRGLVVAANEGLFVSSDGEHFTRLLRGTEGWNGLALDGKTLWATTALAVYRFSVEPRALRVRSSFERPGGSTALQGVTVAAGEVWLASEDRGVLRVHGKTAVVLDRAAGMPSSWVVDVAAIDGVVYAATLRDGLVRLTPTSSGAAMTRIAGAFPWLLHLGVDDKTLWIGAQGGAMHLGAGDDRAISLVAPALPHDNVYAFARVGGALFLGTEGGLLAVDGPTL